MIYTYFQSFFEVLLGDLMNDIFLSFLVHMFINVMSIVVVLAIISLPFWFFLKLFKWRSKK